MKRILLMAALLAAALGARAQQQDTTSIMLQHLARTNYNVQHINDALRTHSTMAVSSVALGGFAAFCFARMAKYDPNVEVDAVWVGNRHKTIYPARWHDEWKVGGIVAASVSGVLFLCSYIPIWTQKVKLNERGLVIELDK